MNKECNVWGERFKTGILETQSRFNGHLLVKSRIIEHGYNPYDVLITQAAGHRGTFRGVNPYEKVATFTSFYVYTLTLLEKQK